MTTGFLELRHVECEGPADYLPALEEFGPVHTVRLWQEPLPETVDYRGIVVMGGPVGANDGAVVPWIDDEIAYLRSALASDVPVWGVCLGAQLLAAALDAKVYSGPAPEVGVCDVELTAASAADPVWGELPASFPTLGRRERQASSRGTRSRSPGTAERRRPPFCWTRAASRWRAGSRRRSHRRTPRGLTMQRASACCPSSLSDARRSTP